MYISWWIEDLCFCDIYMKGGVIYPGNKEDVKFLEPKSKADFLLGQSAGCLFRSYVLGPMYSSVSLAWGAAILASSLFGLFHSAFIDMGQSNPVTLRPEGLSLSPLSHFFWILLQIPKRASEKLAFCEKNQIAEGEEMVLFLNKASLWELLHFRNIFALKCLCFSVFRS